MDYLLIILTPELINCQNRNVISVKIVCMKNCIRIFYMTSNLVTWGMKIDFPCLFTLFALLCTTCKFKHKCRHEPNTWKTCCKSFLSENSHWHLKKDSNEKNGKHLATCSGLFEPHHCWTCWIHLLLDVYRFKHGSGQSFYW